MIWIGAGVADAGVFIGRKAAEAYRAIDPDVRRHFYQVPLLGYSLLVSRREDIEPGEPDGYPPLIFVHGLGGNRGNFVPMAWYLWLKGRKRSYKIHFDSGQCIGEMAAALGKFIAAVTKATGEKQVEIVAHSLGGVIARMAISSYGAGDSVKTLVTLGAPHRGTYAARYAGVEVLRDIRPDSDFIAGLNDTPLPEGLRVVTFYSRNDVLVIPPESAVIDGAEHIDASPFTHYSYLIDPKSWAAVGRALKF